MEHTTVLHLRADSRSCQQILDYPKNARYKPSSLLSIAVIEEENKFYWTDTRLLDGLAGCSSMWRGRRWWWRRRWQLLFFVAVEGLDEAEQRIFKV